LLKEEIKFRIADAIDAEVIASLVNSVYRGEGAKKGWTTEADLLGGIRINTEMVNKLISSPGNIILLALINDKIVGCVHLEKKNSNKCYLGLLSVDVNYQNKKIGRAMIDKCEAYAKNIYECDEMEMRVFELRKELVEFYLRRGYSLTEKREPFLDNSHVGIPKVRDFFLL